jgi:hypothetical protein
MIRRLEREISEIDRFIYSQDVENDRHSYAGMLERKRDDVVRAAVLQVHTAIEDLLTRFIIHQFLGATSQNRARKLRSKSGRALQKTLSGPGSMGFEMKLNFAVALRLLTSTTKARLAELNALRNKVSHNWVLKMPIRRGRRPDQRKPPLLHYRGQDLHRVDVLKQFLGEFGTIYIRLWMKAYR